MTTVLQKQFLECLSSRWKVAFASELSEQELEVVLKSTPPDGKSNRRIIFRALLEVCTVYLQVVEFVFRNSGKEFPTLAAKIDVFLDHLFVIMMRTTPKCFTKTKDVYLDGRGFDDPLFVENELVVNASAMPEVFTTLMRETLLSSQSTNSSMKSIGERVLELIGYEDSIYMEELFGIVHSLWMVPASSDSTMCSKRMSRWAVRKKKLNFATLSITTKGAQKHQTEDAVNAGPDPSVSSQPSHAYELESMTITKKTIDRINAYGLEKLVVDGCDVCSTLDTTILASSAITCLVFRNMKVCPMYIFSPEVLAQLQTLEIHGCESLSQSHDFVGLRKLVVKDVGPDVLLSVKNSTRSLKNIILVGDPKNSHGLVEKSPPQILELIRCTHDYIYSILHGHPEHSIIETIEELKLWWDINRPRVHRQLHLNWFARLRSLSLRNMPLDAISTRNQFKDLTELVLFVRDHSIVSGVLKKYIHSRCLIVIVVEDSTRRFEKLEHLQGQNLHVCYK